MTMYDMQLPYFMVIGAMKAGTTSLHYYLSRHPDLSMPSSGKELDFFNRDINWGRGMDWYKSNFDNNNKKKGEVNPNYTMSKSPGTSLVPSRIHSLIPDVLLIYVLRDPVERMISHVHHNWIDGVEIRSIDEIVCDVNDNGNYRCYGRYFFQISEYLQFFKKENILILKLEDLEKNRKNVMERIFSFLGVEKNFYEDSYRLVMHSSADKRVPGAIQQALQKQTGLNGWQRSCANIFSGFPFAKILGKKIPKPVLTDQQRQVLIDDFREDVARLKNFTGLDFSEWKHRY